MPVINLCVISCQLLRPPTDESALSPRAHIWNVEVSLTLILTIKVRGFRGKSLMNQQGKHSSLTSFDRHISHHIFKFCFCVWEKQMYERDCKEWRSDTTVMSDWSVAWHLSLVHIRSPQDPLLSASVSSTHEWFININTKHKPQCASQISSPY